MRRVFQLEDKQINDALTPNQNLFPISMLYLTQTIKTSGILKREGNERRNLATRSWNIATSSQKTRRVAALLKSEPYHAKHGVSRRTLRTENRNSRKVVRGGPEGSLHKASQSWSPVRRAKDKLTALGNLLQTNPLTRQSKWTHFAAHRYLTSIRLRFLKVEMIQKGSLDTGSNYIQSSKNLWNVARFWKWPFCV